MTAPLRTEQEAVSVIITEAEVDEVLAEFGEDPRRAIRSLLEDIAVLALDQVRTVSYGYVKGHRLYRGLDSRKLP
jgi:hypothetical protein